MKGTKTGTIVHVVIDQFGHGIWAFVMVWVAMRYPGVWWAGALAALMLCLPRELVDQWPIENWWDTTLDIMFFIFGGVLAALLI
jgi:hypothetical protein